METAMKKRANKGSKKQPKQATGKTPPAPSRLMSEQMMRDIHRLLQDRDFANIDEANAFLASLMGTGLEAALQDAGPASAKWEAQELAFDAMDAPSAAKAKKLAKRALEKDPDCVDALVVLADIECRSQPEFITAMQNAVAAGERSLGAKFFKENTGDFWGLIETRPYMRARLQLAESLRGTAREEEAIGHYEGVLELNPNDNQGGRDILLGCYLAAGDLARVHRLFRQYEDDISAVFAWARVLERFLANDLPGARQQLNEARERNRLAGLYLTGQRKMPKSMPGSYALGSEEEAIICADLLAEAWGRHKEALLWLIKQLEAN
jgi:tetratricopeptide (TPR) repeat protein